MPYTDFIRKKVDQCINTNQKVANEVATKKLLMRLLQKGANEVETVDCFGGCG